MEFPTWLRGRGGKINPELDLFHTLASGDRGVVARSDVPEGELLLLLPIDCAIYIPNEEEFNRRPESFPAAVRYLRESHPDLSPFLATTLVLMSEVTRGSASPWAAYVDTLPPSCPDCLLHWSSKEKLELEGTSLEQSGPDPAVDVYGRHVAPILADRPDLWPGLLAAEVEEGAAAGQGATAAGGLQAFLRVAGLVQSRAFHLEAENWVSGAKEISKLEGGGTQVFLLPGIDMINHSHSAARRNAHLERLSSAQVAAAKLLDAPGADGAAPAAAFFVMRADKPIKAGEEVLHTYGNLSDAQLLQTYGFLDSDDGFLRPHSAAAAVAVAAVASEGPSARKRAKAGKSATAAAADGDVGDGDGGDGGGYRNQYNATLVPWTAVEEVCTGLLRSMGQAPPGPLRRAKRDFLASLGVLQPAAPDSTQFVLLAQEPLPDELLTAVQVLLMTKEEFHELRREFGGDTGGGGKAGGSGKGPGKAGGGKAGGGKSGGKGGDGGKAAAGARRGAGDAGGSGEAAEPAAAAAQPKLLLGTSLLEEDDDFAEMVCFVALQVLEACMERYPTAVKDDVRQLRSPECTGRQRLAVRVRLGEKDVLQLAKKAAVELLRRLRGGGAAPAAGKEGDEEGSEGEEGEGEDSEGEESSGSDEEDDDGEEEEVEQVEGGGRRASKRQRRGVGAPPPSKEGDEGGGGAGSGSSGSDDEAAADDLLMGSDDSEKVGYGAEEYDDGIGEAHDRGKAHEAPHDD